MKKKLLYMILTLFVVVHLQAKKIALLEPRIAEGSTEVSAMEKNMVRGELRKAIVNESGYEAFTRADIDQIMKEQNFQRTGMVSNDQIKRLGEMSGADYICVSTLTKSNTEFYLEAYLIDVETGGILNPASQYGELENGKLSNMLQISKVLAAELMGSSGVYLRNNYDKQVGSNENFNTVTDCQGHIYPVVRIGSQLWMAENLQCTKYDTQSERAGEMLLKAGIKVTDNPYYVDGRNRSIWNFYPVSLMVQVVNPNMDLSKFPKSDKSVNLTTEQILKFGMLYNWVAAMGYTDSEAKSQTGDYSGTRQGICPNGWHIPSKVDWDVLANYCSDKNSAGAKLKSKSGWWLDGNGTDAYGFCALPTDGIGLNFVSSSITEVNEVGANSYFWTSDANDLGAYYVGLKNNSDSFNSYYCKKSSACSVRCVKD